VTPQCGAAASAAPPTTWQMLEVTKGSEEWITPLDSDIASTDVRLLAADDEAVVLLAHRAG
jgi:hypothetical protein